MSDLKGLLKHSSNYFFANLAIKALAFISIPVYTRLLTVEDYGIVNVFFATVQITTILLTLNTEVAISRFFYDKKNIEDFKDFVGTSVIITGGVFILMAILTLLLLPQLSELTHLSQNLVLFTIPVSLYYIINSIFTQIYNPLLKSKKIALVSSLQIYLAFGLSVVFILLLPSNKYYGQVYGTVAAMLVLSGYLVYQIKPYLNFKFHKKFVKYILSFSLPNLPYALSGLILTAFGRLIIGRSNGFEDAGIYSFAANIGGLMLIVISVTHQAWNPYYFKYMNENDTTSLDKDYSLIWKLTLVAALFLSVFGFEIGTLLGRRQYFSSLYLIPIFTLGYVFYQWAYAFMRNCSYAKKMIWNAVVVIMSGCCNIVLSMIFIRNLGNLGVAVAFVVSYFFLLVLSFIINKYQLKLYVPNYKLFARPLLIYCPLAFIGLYLYFPPLSLSLTLTLKFCIFSIGSLFLLKSYISKFIINKIYKH